MNKPFFWSISRMKDYFTCPRQFEAKHVTKQVKFEQTDATIWGNQVHKSFEDHTNEQKPFPENTKHLEPLAIGLASIPGIHIGEQKFAFNRQLSLTKYFANDVYGRCIVDRTIVQEPKKRALVIDYKTGSPSYVDSDQLKLSALCVLEKYPQLDGVKGKYVFTKDFDHKHEVAVSRKDAAYEWQQILNKVNIVEQATTKNEFPPKPSGLCRKWCPVKTCEYNGDYNG